MTDHSYIWYTSNLLENDTLPELYTGEIYNFKDVVVEILSIEEAIDENITKFGVVKECIPNLIATSFHLDVLHEIPMEYRGFYDFSSVSDELEDRIFKAGMDKMAADQNKPHNGFCVRASHSEASFHLGNRYWFVQSPMDVIQIAKHYAGVPDKCRPIYLECLWKFM